MTLSNSRQQFLAYESHHNDDIQYGRRGGIFLSTCVCIGLVILAVIVAVLVGVIVYFITYFKLSQKSDFWDESEPFGITGPPSPDQRLPLDVVPSFYRLKLKTDLDNSNFTGEVYITIKASKKVKEIILHSKDLIINGDAKLTEQIYEKVEPLRNKRQATDLSNSTADLNTTTLTSTTVAPIQNVTELPSTNTTLEIVEPTSVKPLDTQTQVTHSSVRNIKIISIKESSGDRLILTLASSLKTNVDYTLELSFEGKISNSMTGFYKSTYKNDENEVRTLGTTQFEPISARAAFPCFDEPAFKARFEISIAHPKNLTALSNMKVAAQEPVVDIPNWQWTHFERSVMMSTYLVAYVISDFKSMETSYLSKDNVTKPIRVWTRPELIHKVKYALTIAPKILQFYEDVFGVPYALDKMDLVAIPDFSSGAMENWGLVTFRETTLLFDEEVSNPRDKQGVAIDVAHELAHQWFGNLVTMEWWTDLWLNEGFATYIEYIGVDHVEPDWNMLEGFTSDKMDLFRADSLKNTSPVSKTVTDASEIAQKFDDISYNKGANLIRMLNHTISVRLFQKGLVHYLDTWKFSNADENDLWEAMAAATKDEPELKDISLVEFMNSWTKQAGFPVVTVNRDYNTNEVQFKQRLFTSSPHPYKSMEEQIWQIPISYKAIDAPVNQLSTKPMVWLIQRSVRTRLRSDIVNSSQALYANVGAIGYYRVNYDQKNWQLLSDAVKSGLVQSPITKAQLIDDAFNLAKADQLNYSYALDLSTCVIDGEDAKIVWEMLLNNLAFLKYSISMSPGYGYFQEYMKILLRKQLERLNYGLEKPKNDNEAFLVENLVGWECSVESRRCMQWTRDQFDNWTNQTDLTNNPIPSHLRSLVYNMAVRHGGRREFEFLYNIFQNSTDPNVKSLIINNLPSSRDPSLVTTLLERSLSEIPKQYALSAWRVEPYVGAAVAQNFLLDNFDRVYERFMGIDSFTFSYVLKGAFGFITRQEQLDRLKSFALEHKDKLLSQSMTLQKLVDTATLRVNWIQRHANEITRWLEAFVRGKSSQAPPATAPTSSPTAVNAEQDTSSTTPGVVTTPAIQSTAAATVATSDIPASPEANAVSESAAVSQDNSTSTTTTPPSR